MENILNSLANIIKVLVATIGLLLAQFLHGSLLAMESVETAFQAFSPSVQVTSQLMPQGTSQSNVQSNVQSNAQSPKTQTPKDSTRRYKGERASQKLNNLPNTQTTTSQISAANVIVEAGDKSVSSTEVKAASQIVKDISLPTLNTVLGLTPATKISIVLFSSAKTYGNALSKTGIDSSSIQSMISDTGGVTVNTTIWIPLYNIEDNSDLTNVLSHELFHACAASQGYGSQLPIWINEGTAWRIGLMAQQKVNPQKASSEMAYYENEVRQAAQNGTILSLDVSEKDILNANYNVEYEDFMAVEQLTKTYGVATYKTFIENLKSQSVDNDFQKAFNSTLNAFQSSFSKSLLISEQKSS
ncbi:MAG: hypothetical protein P4L49_03050 [Desulfosporosinus sp.]|nr:hypothetical protein [Desulfosporosinus sp.]